MNLKLKQVRKENGYSQADLADALSVDIKTVGNWERGKTLPDIEQLWKCAKVRAKLVLRKLHFVLLQNVRVSSCCLKL